MKKLRKTHVKTYFKAISERLALLGLRILLCGEVHDRSVYRGYFDSGLFE